MASRQGGGEQCTAEEASNGSSEDEAWDDHIQAHEEERSGDARLVAMGYNQDLDPLVKPSTQRLSRAALTLHCTVQLLLSIAQIKKFIIHQIDISNAFMVVLI